MDFHVVSRDQQSLAHYTDAVLLVADNWNDHHFITMFRAILFDEHGERHDLGQVKIGFVGQDCETPTHSQLEPNFQVLPPGFFSLGTTVDYYHRLVTLTSEPLRYDYLSALRDVVHSENAFNEALHEEVFNVSLLRAVSVGSIESQFRRVLKGGAIRTNYSFAFVNHALNGLTSANLTFEINAESSPPCNIHAIIGRNGVGKTTILNSIVESVRPHTTLPGRLLVKTWGMYSQPIDSNYFSSVILVSFSAFDPFDPPDQQSDRSKGTCIYYVGLKEKIQYGIQLKSPEELRKEFYASLRLCFSDGDKKAKWSRAIRVLQSDMNFEDIGLFDLLLLSGNELREAANNKFSALSSGHAIVLLTITRLVEMVEEKTLILLDEPESHLHPPLLSSFVRALSDLLLDRNGVAILATHSPVVLQEIPASCVWKVNRSGLAIAAQRPQIETFGENLGILTREVFGLEAENCGFHTLLASAVNEGLSYEAVTAKFNYQLGYEAQAILRAMIARRGWNNRI